MSDLYPENRPTNVRPAAEAATAIRGLALHQTDTGKRKFFELLVEVLEGKQRRTGKVNGKRYDVYRSENGVTVEAHDYSAAVLAWATEAGRAAGTSIIKPYARPAQELMVRFATK